MRFRRLSLLLSSLVLTASATACDTGGSEREAATTVASTSAPAGTTAPETATDEEPGAGDDATAADYRLEPVATELDNPVHVAVPDSGANRVYIVLKGGFVRVVDDGRLVSAPFLDLHEDVTDYAELGLHSIAFHPGFRRHPFVYAAYNDATNARAVTVAEFRVEDGRVEPRTRRVLVRVPHRDSPYHNGGQVAFGGDGRLYVSVGDGGYLRASEGSRLIADPHGNAQNLRVLLGKVFRLDVDAEKPRPDIVAYGLRNPWRFSFDERSGDVIIGDVGYSGFEEIDVLRRGSGLVNFGWSTFEGRQERGEKANPKGRLVWPSLVYKTGEDGNCSIIGGFVYRGAVDTLRGRYVFGDYCSGRVWSTRLRGRRASGVRLEPVEVPSLVSFGEDSAGELYAVSLDGDVFRFAAKPEADAE